tara:strand:+ start:606 stop:1469 length:864 start_codon:yes stop_codon:yes gene_type:complete
MIDLGLSVLFTSLLYVIFKLFPVFKVQTLYAIIANYFTAGLVGVLFFGTRYDLTVIPMKSWFPGTVALGILFITVFNILAKTSQTLGVSVASVASKMSLVIPILCGLALYNETLGSLQVLGILFALSAVYFVSVKEKTVHIAPSSLLLPLLVFLGSGAIDASIKYLQDTFVPNGEYPMFSSTIFFSAGIAGIFYIAFKAFKTPLRFRLRNVIGGIVLGVPNYFTVHFLLRALKNEELNSAAIFTINNVGVVLFSTLLGIVLFKEKLSPANWGGIFLAIVSIILVALF